MKLRRRFRFWLIVLLELAFGAAAVATGQFWVLLIAGPVTALSWYLVEGPRALALSRWGANVGAMLLMAVVAASALSEPDLGRSMELLVILVEGVLVIRQLQQRTPREDALQIVLAVILVLASSMQAITLLFGVVLLAFAALAIYLIMLLQIYAGAERASQLRGEQAPPDAWFVPPVSSHFGPSDLSSLRRMTVRGFIGALLVSVVVFVVFPRHFFGDANKRGGTRRSGFTQEIDLISSDRISESRREVFTMQWFDPAGAPMQWPDPVLLRGAVLNRYDPVLDRWRAVAPSRRAYLAMVEPSEDGSFEQIGQTPIQQRIQTYTVRVSMRALVTDVVFAPWVPIAIANDDGRTFRFRRWDMLLAEVGTDRLGHYDNYALLVQPTPSAVTVEKLQGRSFEPRGGVRFPVEGVRRLALNILDELRENPEPEVDETVWQYRLRVAQALTGWLETRCRYTTDLSDFVLIPGEDPIVSFLSRYQFGHCEYFASALTAMCQSIGIESRLVTGFVALEYDAVSQRYTVRESNAHAWTEVRTGEFRWTALDPSPRADLEAIQARNRNWTDSWRWMLDRLEFFWSDSIVGFDTKAQSLLQTRMMERVEATLASATQSIGSGFTSLNRFFRFGMAGTIWFLSITVLAVSFVVVGLNIRRRRRQLVRELRLVPDEADRLVRLAESLEFWADAVRRADRGGYKKQNHETPLAFAERVGRRDAHAGSQLQTLARLLYRVRFGGQALDRQEEQEAEKMARSVCSG